MLKTSTVAPLQRRTVNADPPITKLLYYNRPASMTVRLSCYRS